LSTCGKRERKERGEILNKDGRKIKWMKEIWTRRERIKKKDVKETATLLNKFCTSDVILALL
jgi:hypothetical protein